MRAAALMLLLAVPAGTETLADMHPSEIAGAMEFQVFTTQAAKKAQVPIPEISIGDATDALAWVYASKLPPGVPLDFTVYIDRAFAALALPEELCKIAHHEVCHLRLALMSENDDADHRAVRRCMRQIRVEQCREEQGWDGSE